MIPAAELRLGNKFIGIAGIQTVFAIMDNTNRGEFNQQGYEHLILCKENRNQYNHVEIEPIPLTKELFEKTNLIMEGEGGFLFCAGDEIRTESAKDIGVRYCSFFYNKRIEKWMDTQTRLTIDYLHQLQNYYFIMTGQELVITL